ncbi:MAG: glycosyltransferase family A protein [Patescibacteria group bacterium]|jgi:glycosyltransferase involved in cell wall biosynthesis
MGERITLIIPAKNAAESIDGCLKSIALQTRTAERIILVDDYSTDKTVALVEVWKDRLPLTIIRNPKPESADSRGASIARNVGASGIHDGYLFFCDADTILEPDTLERLSNALDMHPYMSFAYGPFIFGDRFFHVPRFSLRLLEIQNYIPTMALLRARDFTGFDESLPRFQDWEIWLRLARAGKQGIRVKGSLYSTPIREHSISAATSGILEEDFRKRFQLPGSSAIKRFLFKLYLRLPL